MREKNAKKYKLVLIFSNLELNILLLLIAGQCLINPLTVSDLQNVLGCSRQVKMLFSNVQTPLFPYLVIKASVYFKIAQGLLGLLFVFDFVIFP